MANIGVVSKTQGEVFAKSKDGQLRRLNTGDTIQDTDTIVTAAGSTVEITPFNGNPFVINPEQTVAMSNDVIGTEVDKTANAVQASTAQTVVQDFNQQLEEEAAAAGLAGGGGGGSSFVNLMRIAEGTNGVNYAFPLNGTGTPPDIRGNALNQQAAGTTTTTPPTDEPPVDPKEPTVETVKEFRTEKTVDVKTETVVGNEYETGRNTTTEVTTESKDGGVLTTTTKTTVITYDQETNTITTTTTTTTTYVRDVTTTTDVDGTKTTTYSDWSVYDVATDTDTDNNVVHTPREETITDVSTDFVIDPPPPEVEPGKWFIAQADNHDKQSSPDKSLDEGKDAWDFVVVYQGNGNYTVNAGETVTVALDMWVPDGKTEAGYGVDYSLDVTGMGQFVVTGWEVKDGQLVVTVAVDEKFDSANLTGNVFDVTVTALSDEEFGDDGELVGFDINNAIHTTEAGVVTVGTAWETNDDVLINVADTTQPPTEDPPTEDPPTEDPPIDPAGENWFISHQGNGNFDQAVKVYEGDVETFNVQFQDRSGEHIGVIGAGETVDVKIAITGDTSTLNLLDIIDVDPSKEFSVEWTLDGNTLDVLLTNISGKDANLQGNPFDVTFDVKNDGVKNTSGTLGFDIQSVSVGGVWESNDQANYVINDMKASGNPHANG